MILNFNNLTSDQKKKIDKIYHELENEFQILQRELFEKNKNNKDFFFSNIASRNNDENEIYYNLCIIELCLRLHAKNLLTKIITKNEAQKKTLIQKIKNIEIVSSKEKNIFLKNTLNLIKNIYYVFQLWINKDIKRGEKIKNLKKIILIDIFFIPKMFSNSIFENRYYGNFLEKIDKEKYNIIYLPTIFQRSLKKKYIRQAEKKINLFLQSDFLKLKDYIQSLTFHKRIKSINLSNLNFRSLKIDYLIKSELENHKFNQSTLKSLINFHCFKRMRQNEVDISLVIDWYENQIIDKGFNYGKNIFYPDVVSKGYVGLNSIFESNKNFIPSDIEISKNITPNQICLISTKYLEKFKKIKKNIKFCLAPAFRSSKLFDEDNFKKIKNYNKNDNIKILINFTGFHKDNIEMISLINQCKILESEEVNVFLRPHIISKKSSFSKIVSKKIKYKFSIKSFYEEMKDTDILISRSSTACFESLVFGVPVLITRRSGGFLPIKNYETFPANSWFFNNDQFDLEKNIKKIISNKEKYIIQNIAEKRKLLNEYFYPITHENLAHFLR